MFSFSANDESKTKICSAFEPFYIELAWENNRVQPSDISRPNHWFPHETRLGNDCGKSILMTYCRLMSGKRFWLVALGGKFALTNQKR